MRGVFAQWPRRRSRRNGARWRSRRARGPILPPRNTRTRGAAAVLTASASESESESETLPSLPALLSDEGTESEAVASNHAPCLLRERGEASDEDLATEPVTELVPESEPPPSPALVLEATAPCCRALLAGAPPHQMVHQMYARALPPGCRLRLRRHFLQTDRHHENHLLSWPLPPRLNPTQLLSSRG
jgi:hypothetical protein